MPSVVTFTDEPMPSRSGDSDLEAYLHNSNEVIGLKLGKNAKKYELSIEVWASTRQFFFPFIVVAWH